jgi:hypothetical protein
MMVWKRDLKFSISFTKKDEEKLSNVDVTRK